MLYTYISHSRIPKTYYGVTFRYGDKKEVSGTISDKHFVFCFSRPNPPVPVVVKAVETEPPTPAVVSIEKPKTARGRKPKVVAPVVEQEAEEFVSTDAE